MGNKYDILKKGTFLPPQTDYKFVSPIQYMIVIEDGYKYLLLKLSNNAVDAVTAIDVEVQQIDKDGQYLDPLKVECKNLYKRPQSQFVLSRKIKLSADCADVSVKILSAEYGNYFGTVSHDKIIWSYMEDDREHVAFEPVRNNVVVEETVSVRKFKISIIACLILLATLALSMLFTYSQLINYMEKETFFYGDVEYAFYGGEKTTYGPIFAIGCNDSAKEITIEEKIKDHEVIGISSGAFKYNHVLEKVTIKGSIPIESETFRNCDRLSVVNIENVTKIGDSAFNSCDNLTEIRAYNLSSIGSYAFSDCSNLRKITIQNDKSILKIGYKSFSWCIGLETVDIDQYIDYSNGVDIFNTCTNIISLRLKNYNYSFKFNGGNYEDTKNKPISNLFGYDYGSAPMALRKFMTLTIDYISCIPQNFSYSLPLRSITIKNLEMSEIEPYAFYECNNLLEINLPLSVSSVGNYAFYSTALLSFDTSNLSHIGTYSFSGTYFESFTLPAMITNIPGGAFENCRYLKEFIVEGELYEIGDYAFSRCYALEDFEFPETLITIGEYAFSDCEVFTVVNLPSGVSEIGKGAFFNCRNLEEITLPFIGGTSDSNKFLTFIFGATYATDWSNYYIPSTLKKVTVLSADVIDSYAFYGCYYIEEIIIESNYKSIGKFAFYDCRNLRSFVLPFSLNSIEDEAFGNCFKLFEVYNLAKNNLKIARGAKDNGCVGYYALKIYNSLTEEKIASTEQVGYKFLRCDLGNWYLTDYPHDATELKLPENIYYKSTRIDSYSVVSYLVFDNNRLTSIEIPNTVNAISDFAFSDCFNVVDIKVLSKNITIGFGAFYNNNSVKNITVPFVGGTQGGSETESGDKYFGYIFGFSDPKFGNYPNFSPEKVILTNAYDIPDMAFAYFEGLKEISLPDTLTVIGKKAFFNCTRLKEVRLPASLNAIGESAFQDCYSIEVLYIQSFVDIKSDAFWGCSYLFEIYNLSALNIVAGSVNYGYVAYYALVVHNNTSSTPIQKVIIQGMVFKEYANKWVLVDYTGTASNLTLATFKYQSDTISSYSIKERAFANKDYPTYLTITDAVSNIGERAFENCGNLKSVIFEDSSIARLNDYVFSGCTSLETIVLPEQLIQIGFETFFNCIRLYTIKLPASLVLISENAFRRCFALFDVINLSILFTVNKGLISNGYVGYYAERVTNYDIAPLQSILYLGCRFVLFLGDWHLVTMDKDSVVMPFSVNHNGLTINSYILRESALAERYYASIYIPKSVSALYIKYDPEGFYWGWIYIFYQGSASEWAQLLNGMPYSPYLDSYLEYNTTWMW